MSLLVTLLVAYACTIVHAKKVIIVGAGVSGLTAATELALRGYEVVIYERQAIPGGKIKAYKSPDGLPMEHGFHFFPGEYQNLPRTFAQIPYNGSTLLDHLVVPPLVGLAIAGSPMTIPSRVFDSWDNFVQTIHTLIEVAQLGITVKEVEFWSSRYVSYLSSSDRRRHEQFQNMTYTQVIAPGGKKCWSKAYWDLLVDGMSIDLVASQPDLMSADTMMQVLAGIFWGEVARNATSDRIFNGPGDDVWTGPWVKYLESLGVTIHYNQLVTKLQINKTTSALDGIEFVNTVTGATATDRTAAYYLIAVPMERMVTLARNSSLFDVDKKLASIQKLEALWMNGVFIYLKKNIDVVNGHIDFAGSPWALTMLSARQFWPNFNWSTAGDGLAGGVLSMIISDWFTIGYNGKVASECTPDEILAELLTQIHAVYPGLITTDNIHSWYIDHDIAYDQPYGLNTESPSSTIHQSAEPIVSYGEHYPWYKHGIRDNKGVAASPIMSNAEPLMVNYVGSWWNRPDGPTTALTNMFISGDYIKTSFQLACAETANEAGKYAANAILSTDSYAGDHVTVYSFEYPEWLQKVQKLDDNNYAKNPSSKPPLWTPDPTCGQLHP